MCPDNKIPQGLLLATRNEIVDALAHFKQAKAYDAVNEGRPAFRNWNKLVQWNLTIIKL